MDEKRRRGRRRPVQEMDENAEARRKYHRGRRRRKKKRKSKKSAASSILSTLILIIAIGVFCYSGVQLFTIYKGYNEGEEEYEEIATQAVSIENVNGEEKFTVDFDALKKMNSDVVGWIRFEEPAIINYPVVQGEDNYEYLDKTFQGYSNTVGTIFVNYYNNPDFEDNNTIIYGHRMNNETMFNKLKEYRDEEFWKKHPYFYIYTPDGREMKYTIYSVGEVHEASDMYNFNYTQGNTFGEFILASQECSLYDTEVNVNTRDKIVMLSTCIKGKDEYRLVVFGVRTDVNK